MSVLVIILGYCLIASIIGGISYAVFHESKTVANGSDDDVMYSLIGACFWPASIFIFLAWIIASITKWAIKEKTNPWENV